MLDKQVISTVMEVEMSAEETKNIYPTYISFETEEERGMYRSMLIPEHRRVLDKAIWKDKSVQDAALHLLKQATTPSRRKVIVSLAAGTGTVAGMATTGASLATSIISGLCAITMADIIITGLEEDEATRKVGEGIRRFVNRATEKTTPTLRKFFVDKPKGLWQRLAVKESK